MDTGIQAGTHFSALNLTVLGLYLAAMLAIGWRLSGRQKTGEDFFLAGRRMPWLAVGMSMYASVTSAMTFMGLPGMAYSQNVSLLVVSLMSPIVAPVLIFLLYPFYRRLGLTTSYGYIDLRFGPTARVAVASLFLLARLGWLGTVIYAPALALHVVSGLPLYAGILLMGGLATVYTVMGGLSAVIWTDVAQFLIMIGGAVWLAISLSASTPGGVGGILDTARAAGHLNMADWQFDPQRMTSLAVAVSYFFLLLQDYGVDQVSVQRLLAVRTNRGVAAALVFNAFIDLLVIGLLLFVGLGLFAYYRAFPQALAAGLEGDRVLPYYIIQKLPDGLSGLLVTAIFAAAMSSLDSGINSMATVILKDLARPFRTAARVVEEEGRLLVRRARWLTVGLGGLATGTAFFVIRIEGIIRSFYTFMSLFSAPVLALFLLGMLTRRAHVGGWLAGALPAMALTLAAQRGGWMHEIYYFPFCFLVTLALGGLASLILPRGAPRALAGLTVWDRA